MSTERQPYTVAQPDAEHAVLTGVLRLDSPKTYETMLTAIRHDLDAADEMYTLDVSGVSFMNSSGITAISRLVLSARTRGITLVIRGNKDVRWQQRTFQALTRLYSGLRVDLS